MGVQKFSAGLKMPPYTPKGLNPILAIAVYKKNHKYKWNY